jgi:hypothetical protein
MKYADEIGSGDPHRRHGDRISLLSFFFPK